MKQNYVKRMLKEGKPAVGTWLSLPDPMAARVMAQVGFDWLNVDMEHSPVNIETAAQMWMNIAAAGIVPLVRIRWNTGENVKRVLDCGAWGIVVPMVNTREEAERAVEAALYPLKGVRSVGGSLHAVNFGTDTGAYYANANDEILIVLQIEHIKGVENADEILSVPGVDATFIGPNDLSASMGLKPQMESDNPRVIEAIDHVFKTAKKHGVAPGIHTANADVCNRRIAEGWQFLAIASELRFMLAGAQTEVKKLNRPPRAEGREEIARY